MRFDWLNDPAGVEAVWSTPQRSRMAAYQKFANSIRSPFVKIGLEVDLYDQGKLLLAPQDQEFKWDILIGAVHAIQDFVTGDTGQKQAEKLFMRDIERLLNHPIQVLAHPFRFFNRNHLKCPTHLYPVLAGLLADSGVALEVNFHTNQPDPTLIRLCVDKGVKIAFASDSHDLAEAGEFWPHFNVLKQAGVTTKQFTDVVFSF